MANTVEATEEQVAETTAEPASEKEKVSEEDAKEAQEQGEKVDEEVEKSAKESRDPVSHKDTKTEDKDNEKRKSKKDKIKEMYEHEEEKTSDSISDKDSLDGFCTILKSFLDSTKENEKYTTKSDCNEVTKSIHTFTDNVNSAEEVSYSVESKQEDKEEFVEKYVTTNCASNHQDAVGYVAKSVQTADHIETTEEDPDHEVEVNTESRDLSVEDRDDFMSTLKAESQNTHTNRSAVNNAYQASINICNNPVQA
ncbi:hypothetical protein [Staphylococcus phage vB_SauH_DELF3]|nr:hypothetical protein [Staphylococcus phage vB_SauH_DELF3]